MKKFNLLASTAIAVSLFCAAPAFASIIQVTPGDMQGWSSPPGENTGGGSATITATPYDGDGSLAVTGDRSRFVLGGSAGLYGDPNAPGATNNLGTLSQFTDTSFSYMLDPLSVSNLGPLYSPALRLVLWNGGIKDELVFEQAYTTGGYGTAAPIGTWNVTDSNSLFYLKSNNNENNAKTIADWITSNNLGGATVGGVYVGVGSSVGGGYLAHVDNIIAGGNTYKFDMTGGAVPEPSSWALMIMGFGGAGAALRSRRRKVAFA